MSVVTVSAEAVASAAAGVSRIGSWIEAAHAAAAPSTTAVAAAGADEISTAIAALFCGHARQFAALSAQAAVFHQQFAAGLAGGGVAYAAAEARNAAAVAAAGDPLAALIDAAQPLGVFSPVKLLTGRALFVNGADGAAGSGAPGAPGGWLLGNGGAGGSGIAGTSTHPTGGTGGPGGAAGRAGPAAPSPPSPATLSTPRSGWRSTPTPAGRCTWPTSAATRCR
jgi:hypothetical protein